MSVGAPGRVVMAAVLVALAALVACEKREFRMTWKKPPAPAIDTPEGFANLWATNCAGCHGADGSLGPARPMRDASYLAAIDDASFTTIISNGSPPGTLMPAFAQSKGGALSDAEIAAIVSGMRRAWGAPSGGAESSSSAGAGASTKSAPAIPWSARASGGDASRGEAAFARFCAACHVESDASVGGTGSASNPPFAGRVTDPFYLQLVSDQAIRSSIIFGRKDLDMPGADGPFPGLDPSARLSPRDVDDLVAWFAKRRASDWPPKGVGKGGSP